MRTGILNLSEEGRKRLLDAFTRCAHFERLFKILFAGGEAEPQLIESDAIRLDPNFATAYCDRGDAYRNKGNFDRAIADYKKALSIDPNYRIAANNKRVAEEMRSAQKKKKGWFG